jgi:hypothetical protein
MPMNANKTRRLGSRVLRVGGHATRRPCSVLPLLRAVSVFT